MTLNTHTLTNKTKRQVVANGNYSTTANSRTKLPRYFAGYLTSFAVFQKLLFIYATIYRGTSPQTTSSETLVWKQWPRSYATFVVRRQLISISSRRWRIQLTTTLSSCHITNHPSVHRHAIRRPGKYPCYVLCWLLTVPSMVTQLRPFVLCLMPHAFVSCKCTVLHMTLFLVLFIYYFPCCYFNNAITF
jgi:hypothetical protein